MMLDGLISLLTGNPAVSALVGTRVYMSVLPRGYTLPAVAVHRYNGTREYDFAGPVDVREDFIQLDPYGADPETTQQLAEAIKALLDPYVGALPDGTVVQGCFLERDMDMPFMAKADTRGQAFHSVLGYRVVTETGIRLPGSTTLGGEAVIDGGTN